MDESLNLQIAENLVPKPDLVESLVQDVLRQCKNDNVPTLPITSFILQAAEDEAPDNSLYKSIALHAKEIATMPAISLISPAKADRLEEIDMLREWRAGDLLNLSETLVENGVVITTDELDCEPPNNTILMNHTDNSADSAPKLTDLLYYFQKEIIGLYAGTRVLAETTALLTQSLSRQGLPVYPTIAMYEFGSLWDTENGAAGLFRNVDNEWNHVITILDGSTGSGIDDIYRLQQIVKSESPVILGRRCGRVIRASHEHGGHSAFYELFPIQQIEKYKDEIVYREKFAHLDRTLSEGYAIYIENIAARAAIDASPQNSKEYAAQSVVEFQQMRKKHLQDSVDDPISRVYPDGNTLMQNIIAEMELLNMPHAMQLDRIRGLLRTVDLLALAKITPTDDLYMKCVHDPLQFLPRVKY